MDPEHVSRQVLFFVTYTGEVRLGRYDSKGCTPPYGVHVSLLFSLFEL